MAGSKRGPYEQSRPMDYLEVACFSKKINNTLTMVDISSTDKVDLLLLRSAVKETMLRQPNLRTNVIYGSGSTPTCYKAVPMPPDEELLEVLPTNTDWQKYAIEEVNKDLGVETFKPLFKVKVIPVSDTQVHILMFFHHGVADGLSRRPIIRDILAAYEGLYHDPNFHHIFLPPIPSVLDVAYPNGLSEEQKLETQKYAEQLTKIKMNIDLHLKFEKSNHLDDVNDKTLFFVGIPENMAQLLLACRREHVTVGTVAMAASAFAVAKLRGKGGIELTMSEPIGLRSRFQDATYREHASLAVANGFFSCRADENSNFWDVARKQKSDLDKFVEREHHFLDYEANAKNLIETNMAVKRQAEFFGDIHDGRYVDWATSNHGQWPFKTSYGPLTLKGIYVGGARWSGFFGSVVVLLHSLDRLFYSIVCKDMPLDQKEAETVFHLFTQLMENVGKKSSGYTFADFLRE